MQLGETFDLAQVYGAGEAIKGARLRNADLEQQNQTRTLFRDTAKAAVDPQTGEYNATAHARALTTAGYPEAGRELLTRNMDYYDKVTRYVDAQIPRMNQHTYPAIKQKMEEAGYVPKGYMPEQYDKAWVDQQYQNLLRKRGEVYSGMEELYASADGTRVVGQRNLATGETKGAVTIRPQKPGRPLPVENADGTRTYADPSTVVGKRAPQPAGQAPKPFVFKATDSNTIYRQAAGLFGGLYDPLTGRISGLNKEQSAQVQRISARAARIMKESSGEIDHASAVEEALNVEQGGGQPSTAGTGTVQRPQPAGPPVHLLKPGVVTAFKNGQAWTLGPNGQPQQVR